MSQWFKDRFYASRALQYPYRSWLDRQSRAALARRQPFEASRRMLHMWRQLGTEGFGAQRVGRLMAVGSFTALFLWNIVSVCAIRTTMILSARAI